MDTSHALGIAVLFGVFACSSDPPTSTDPGPSPAGSGGSGTGGSSTGGSGVGGSGVGGSGVGGSGVGGSSVGGSGSGGAGGSAGSDMDGSAGSGGSAAGAGGSGGSAACTRDGLKALVDKYFEALAAHSAAALPLASSVKFTENGDKLELGEGLWKTAGAVKFKHSAFDTEICTSVTESVVPDGSTDIPYGLRLKLVDQKLAEIESIAVRSGDYFTPSNTRAISATASEKWEDAVPTDQRATREKLGEIVDVYFKRFPAGACGFASDCKRLENGFSPGACTLGLSCSTSGSGSSGMTPRLQVLDVEAGIAVGFVMFARAYTDFHMFKVRGGEVHGVHAILASAPGPGW